jgi:serine/threonine protein kinase
MQAQECCEGGSIGKLIQLGSINVGKKRLYSYHDAWRWSLQIAKAVQYMHESNPRVIHRDLKADNLLLTKPGRAGDIRIIDFGLAKLCSKLLASHPALSACAAR